MYVEVDPVHLTLPRNDQLRSKGIHVSSIIRCVATETGVLKPEWCEELDLLEVLPSSQERFNDPTVALRISLGLAWEEHYIPRIPDVIDHPGEMKVHGVYMTHDGESLDSIVMNYVKRWRLCIHEVKFTYKSLNTVGNPEKDSYDEMVAKLKAQWMWMAQLKAYCLGADTDYAKLHVLFANHNYVYPLAPSLYCYKIHFTQRELDDNWRMLSEYKTHRLKIELGELDG